LHDLLELIERFDREAVLPDDPVHARALDLLEWRRVTMLAAGQARCRRAVESIVSRRPYADIEPISLHRRLADELRGDGDHDRWPPLVDVSDLMDLLEHDRPLRLEGPDLVHIARTASDLDRFRDHLLARAEACPTWNGAAAAAPSFAGIVSAVDRALDRDGTVRDNATPLLARLRRQARDQEQAVRRSVNTAMETARSRGWTNGPEVTLRGDRFCLPLRSGSSRRIEGIVHDRSGTGGTIFVEPAAVVQMQNDLVECRFDAAAEAERIVLELNRVVEESAAELHRAARLLLLCDEVRSTMLWSRSIGGARPLVESGRPLRLRHGRHPLLLAQAQDPGTVVPLDLVMNADQRALVISGPNAGGKSVALKGVGVFVLIAQCGWDIPARDDTELPLINRLCVDLGDEQSIEMSLSSFTAHLGHLVRFLDLAGPGSLVLCDEIGSGTDPEEGTALAFSVLEGLAERGALVLASTHYGLLKAAVADHPAMENAAMDFDEESLRPRFTLRQGIPGASHAFDIAARLPFPAELLDRARSRLGEDRFQLERLLADLGNRARAAAAAAVESRELADSLRRRERDLAERLAGIDKEKQRSLEAVRREADDLLAEGRRSIEAVVRDLRSSGADSPSIRAGREKLRQLKEKLAAHAPALRKPRAPEVSPGDRVRIPHLGLIGLVIEVRGAKIVADARGMRLTLDRSGVIPVDGGQDQKEPQPTETAGWNWGGDSPASLQEIDLRGFRGDEGWDAVDRLLDRAIPAGLSEIRIIHGVGTGRLAAYLREKLKSDPRVNTFTEAPLDQGGHGVTVVGLAD